MDNNKSEKKLFGNLEKKKIQAYFDFFDKSHLRELIIEEGGVKWTLRKKKTPPQPQYLPHLGTPPMAAMPLENKKEEEKSEKNVALKDAEKNSEPAGNVVKSPIVGTFYQSSSPDAAPFVNVGSQVQKGQTLCIVEAMKIMNEITSPFDGVVQQINVKNGEPVKAQQDLFLIS